MQDIPHRLGGKAIVRVEPCAELNELVPACLHRRWWCPLTVVAQLLYW